MLGLSFFHATCRAVGDSVSVLLVEPWMGKECTGIRSLIHVFVQTHLDEVLAIWAIGNELILLVIRLSLQNFQMQVTIVTCLVGCPAGE